METGLDGFDEIEIPGMTPTTDGAPDLDAVRAALSQADP